MGSQRVRHSLATEQLDSNFLARNIFEFCMHSLLNSKKIQLTKQESFLFFHFPEGSYIVGFPGSSAGKESTYNAGDLTSIPGSGRSPREGINYPLQYSGLENSMERRTWQATVHGVAELDMSERLSLSLFFYSISFQSLELRDIISFRTIKAILLVARKFITV